MIYHGGSKTMWVRTKRWLVAGLALAAGWSLACSGSPRDVSQTPPNVLWVVWDTVRADRLSLYGYPTPTTPKLERWAEGARVFERCASTAGSTLPSHASMFTGLMPTEHGTHQNQFVLDDRFDTIAELFLDAGYRTYLYSANAHISNEHHFDQGFQVEEHPWDERYAAEARRIVQAKLASGDGEPRVDRTRPGKRRRAEINATGALAQRGLMSWLGSGESEKPFFAFLNYMEAHRDWIPSRLHRERVMTPERAAASYDVDMTWDSFWGYTFGLREYEPEEIALIGSIYDATLAELDDLFADLLDALDAGGHLENTVVVLTSDHGEHLGEHGLFDHHFSLYEPLIHVPLVVRYPDRFPPGRDRRPVSTLDLFPTLLELAGIEDPDGRQGQAVSLLSPVEGRVRVAEYPAVQDRVIAIVKRRHREWDPSPWQRRLRAVYDGERKYIEASDSRHELYDLERDPGESNNLIESQPETALHMAGLLETFVSSLVQAERPESAPEMDEEQLERLRAIGYVGD